MIRSRLLAIPLLVAVAALSSVNLHAPLVQAASPQAASGKATNQSSCPAGTTLVHLSTGGDVCYDPATNAYSSAVAAQAQIQCPAGQIAVVINGQGQCLTAQQVQNQTTNTQAVARALAARARACTPPQSARCQNLRRQAMAAAQKANALRQQLFLKPVNFNIPPAAIPGTGGGGTAPLAGGVPVITGAANPVTGAYTFANTLPNARASHVTALPATGGAASWSPLL